MKKLLILLIAFIVFQNGGFSQTYLPFLDQQSKWSVLEVTGFPTTSFFYNYSVDDTITVDSTLYHVVTQHRDSQVDTFLTREDTTGKVYVLRDSIEVLLYDFAMQVGDSISQADIGGLTYKRAIHRIDTLVLGGVSRRRYHYDSDKWWIEGIGDVNQGPFYPWLHDDFESYANFCSYEYAGAVVYLGYHCRNRYPDGIEESSKESSDIQVFPNPVTAASTLAFLGELQNQGTVTITDLTGRVVKRFANRPNLSLEQKDFPPGMYIVLVETPDMVASKRFLVQ